MDAPILAPAAALILWSVLVLFYMLVMRLWGFKQAGINLAEADVGVRYGDVEAAMPAKLNWLSHNYTHLMEQPTLFYASVAVITLAGEGHGINATLAWGYFISRVVHSLWQLFVNIVVVRVVIFSISSLFLLGLAINAVRATF